jgi:hypothetical protein
VVPTTETWDCNTAMQLTKWKASTVDASSREAGGCSLHPPPPPLPSSATQSRRVARRKDLAYRKLKRVRFKRMWWNFSEAK